MKYKAIYKPLGGSSEVIKICESKESAIECCVEYKHGYFSADTKEERRIGLENRGWAIIGYSGNEVSIEEVTA